MRIATFNANSVRTRMQIILDWLEEYNPDILAIQETKAQDRDFPLQSFKDKGWNAVYAGEKSYNGVAIVSRAEPDSYSFGLGDDDGQSNTRMIHARFGDINIVNTYVPQGRDLEHEMFAFKLEWLNRLNSYFNEKLSGKEVIWLGDLNIAPQSIDVHNSKRIWPHVCHCQEITDIFTKICDFGFTDIFRKFLSGAENFTYWDYRVRDAVERKIGWRIDHILATAKLADKAADCQVDISARLKEKPSDHTFVYADFAL